jgi:hypothetical protein
VSTDLLVKQSKVILKSMDKYGEEHGMRDAEGGKGRDLSREEHLRYYCQSQAIRARDRLTRNSPGAVRLGVMGEGGKKHQGRTSTL